MKNRRSKSEKYPLDLKFNAIESMVMQTSTAQLARFGSDLNINIK